MGLDQMNQDELDPNQRSGRMSSNPRSTYGMVRDLRNQEFWGGGVYRHLCEWLTVIH